MIHGGDNFGQVGIPTNLELRGPCVASIFTVVIAVCKLLCQGVWITSGCFHSQLSAAIASFGAIQKPILVGNHHQLYQLYQLIR